MPSTAPGQFVESAGDNRRSASSGVLVLLLLTGLTLAVRLPLGLREGLRADEVFSLAMATGHSLEHPAHLAEPALGDFVERPNATPAAAYQEYTTHETPPVGMGQVLRAVRISDTSPPLYYLLLNLWTRWFGTGDAALRMLSVIAAAAAIPFLWALARGPLDLRSAWSACVLFSLAPMSLYYSSDGRMYPLVWLLSLALAWLSARMNRLGGQWYVLLAWSLVAAAGLLTHYFFASVTLACVCWLLRYPGRLERSLVAVAAILMSLLVAPWYLQIPDSLARWRVTKGWLDGTPAWPELIIAPFNLTWGLLSGRVPGAEAKIMDWVSLALFVVLGLMALRVRRRVFSSPPAFLLWLWLVSATVGLVAFDLLMDSSTTRLWRYALPALPAVALLAGLALEALRPAHRIALLLAICASWWPGLHWLSTKPARPDQPYREIAAHLAGTVRPDLTIVHSIPSIVCSTSRYLEPETPVAAWVRPLGQRQVPDDLEALLAGLRKVALVYMEGANTVEIERGLRGNAKLLSHKRLGDAHVSVFAPADGETFFLPPADLGNRTPAPAPGARRISTRYSG